MPILIGLTGGIGSGKTTVAKLFEELNIPIYYSDDEAKKLYENPEIQHKITEVAGPDLFVDRELNRALLAKYMFASPEIRAKVNAIIHPLVRENFGHFCEVNFESPYLINEAAILFETGAYKNFQFNILVTAPENIRIQRVMARDGISEELVKQRIKAQWNDKDKILLADFIIQNDGIQSIKNQVMAIHEQLLKTANE